MSTTPDRNPQAEQMADESMVRNLAAQADAIWPQEAGLIAELSLPADAHVLDLACGTGEFAWRFLESHPAATLVGLDLHGPHLELARERCAGAPGRSEFKVGDAFAVDAPDASFDLVACRHLLQAVPDAHLVVNEMARVVKPGGYLHVLAEDYGMMKFDPVDVDTDRFWQEGPCAFAEKTGTDLRVGRKARRMLVEAGLVDVQVHYIVIDTERVPRETFAGIWEAWRDGYAEAIAHETTLDRDFVYASFEAMIAAIRNPDGYGVWLLPAVSGRKP